jgi:hypothetical protein
MLSRDAQLNPPPSVVLSLLKFAGRFVYGYPIDLFGLRDEISLDRAPYKIDFICRITIR